MAKAKKRGPAKRLALSAVERFLKRVFTAFNQVLAALDLDDRQPLPADENGIAQSRVNELVRERRHSEHAGDIGRAYRSARATVADRDVLVLDELYQSFRHVVEQALSGRNSEEWNHEFMDSFERAKQIAKSAKPKYPAIKTSNEARNKWIYKQATKGVAWKTIKADVAKHTEWEPITTIEGVRFAGQRYADAHQLTPIPKRQRGRKPGGRKFK